MNKLARAVKKWTNLCQTVSSFDHHTCEYRQYCHVEKDAGTEGRISVAKSKSTATNLSSQVRTSSSSEKIPIASNKSPGILIATEEPEKQDEKKFKFRRSVELSSEVEEYIPWRVDGHSKR